MTGELVAGRYRLVEEIGEGATGTVYRATIESCTAGVTGSEPDGEPVALKILRPDLAPRKAASGADEAARRFEREAVAAGKLQHANLVGVRDFGALDDGRPFLVMDLVEGRSLADVMADERRLPAARGLRILAHVLRGLRHAHEAGVVHRDLKPADILLAVRDGEPDVAVIVDFGTAALVGAGGAAAEQLTRAGAALGAPAYMAPERLDPEHGPIDGRADLYSATCILFEMLTGQPPFGAFGAVGAVEPAQLLARHRTAARPVLSDVDGVESSPGLDAIVARGLAIDPAERFASAGEYLDAVDAYLDGRLDPSAIGKPAAASAGQLAEPDPSKATTVFHGAPRPDAPDQRNTVRHKAPAAPASDAADAPAAADSPAPDAKTASPGQAADRARARRRVRYAVLGAGGLAAIVVVALLVGRTVGDRAEEARSADRLTRIIDAWRKAGLEPGPLQAVEPAAAGRFGGGECRQGAVSGIEVVLCRHATNKAAIDAVKAGMKALPGGGPTTAYPSGPFLLVARGPARRDPNRTMRKVTQAFRKAAADPARKRPAAAR